MALVFLDAFTLALTSVSWLVTCELYKHALYATTLWSQVASWLAKQSFCDGQCSGRVSKIWQILKGSEEKSNQSKNHCSCALCVFIQILASTCGVASQGLNKNSHSSSRAISIHYNNQISPLQGRDFRNSSRFCFLKLICLFVLWWARHQPTIFYFSSFESFPIIKFPTILQFLNLIDNLINLI